MRNLAAVNWLFFAAAEPDSIHAAGHPGRKHVTQWLVITRDGHKYYEFGHNRCPECGNAFKLKHVELPFPSIN